MAVSSDRRSKPIRPGVMRPRFSGREKKAKTSSIGRAMSWLAWRRWMPMGWNLSRRCLATESAAGPEGAAEDLPGQRGLGDEAHDHVGLLAHEVVAPAA